MDPNKPPQIGTGRLGVIPFVNIKRAARKGYPRSTGKPSLRTLKVRFGSLADMRPIRVMSAFPLIADIHQRGLHVRLVP